MKKYLIGLVLASMLGVFTVAQAEDLTATGMSQKAMYSFFTQVQNSLNALKVFAAGVFPVSAPGLKRNGQNKQEFNCTAFTYVDSNMTVKSKSAANASLGTGTIKAGKVAGWRIQMSQAGTVTVRAAANNTSYPGYASLALATAGIPSAGSGNLSLGTITIQANASSSCKFGNASQDLSRKGVVTTFTDSPYARWGGLGKNGNITMKGL